MLMMASRRDQALQLARDLNWHVFPIYEMLPDGTCSCGKPADAPKHSVGKHPRTITGLKEATNDLKQIEAWWTEWPNANIGVATGPSNIYVVDIDPKNGGEATLAALIKQHGDGFMSTLRQVTGSKGLHLFYRQPEDPKLRLRNTAGALGDGIDTRGDGGYILAPSSNHKSGGTYEWAKNFPMPSWDYIMEVPEWVAQTIREEKPTTGPAPPVPKVLIKGKRNDALLSLAGTMHRRGFVPRAIIEALKIQNDECCVPPVPVKDIEYIVSCVVKYKPEPVQAQVPKPKADSNDWWRSKW
jgi:hypothetical protein